MSRPEVPQLPTGTQIQHARRIEELRADQLSRLRRVAQQWRNGTAIAALAGGAIAAFTTPEVIAAASPCQKLQGAIALGLALVLAIASILLSMRASFGWPAILDLSTPLRLAEWERRELAFSMGCLRAAMWTSAAAVVAFGAACAILVFGYVIPSMPWW